MSSIRTQNTFFLGQQERTDTYTTRLGFVSESTNSNLEKWSKFAIDVYDNVPTEGFVINKVRKGESHEWGRKVDKVRVWDPRGFEIELKIENILRLMMDSGVEKGGLIKEKLVYFWSGNVYPEIKLLPESSEEYQRHLQGYKTLIAPKKINTTSNNIELDQWYQIGSEKFIYTSKKSIVSISSNHIQFLGHGYARFRKYTWNNNEQPTFNQINKSKPKSSKKLKKINFENNFDSLTGNNKINKITYLSSNKNLSENDISLNFYSNPENIYHKGMLLELNEPDSYLLIKEIGFNEYSDKVINNCFLITKNKTNTGYIIDNNMHNYKSYISNNLSGIKMVLDTFDESKMVGLSIKFGDQEYFYK